MKLIQLYLIVICTVYSARCRSLEKKRDIPVSIVYDDPSDLDKTKDAGEGVQIRNLDAKVQLNQEDLNNVDKHKPKDQKPDELVVETLENIMDEKFLLLAKEGFLKSIADVRKNAELKGLKSAVKNLDWLNLRGNVETIFKNYERKLRQANQTQSQGFIGNIIGDLQNATSNFIQGLNRPQNSSQDENKPTVGQNIIQLIQGGLQNAIQNIAPGNQGSSTPSTILGDTNNENGTQNVPTSSHRPLILGTIVQQVQQVIGGNANKNQNDQSGSTTSAPNLIQGAISQINNFINNFNPNQQQSSTASSQSDSGVSTTSAPPNIIQGAISQINNFINNLGGQNNQPSSGQGDEQVSPAPPPPVQFIQNITNTLGSAFNQINVFNQRPTNASSDEKPPNLIQNITSSIGSAINQFSTNVFNRPANASEDERPNIVQNVGTAIQNLIRPQNQISNPTTPPVSSPIINPASNPIISQIQTVTQGSLVNDANSLSDQQTSKPQQAQNQENKEDDSKKEEENIVKNY